MKQQLIQDNNSKEKWLISFLAIVLVLGVFFRVVNIDQKPYWIDESYTLLRASGYTAQEASQQLYNGQVISVNDVLKYQRVSSQGGTIATTITGLAIEEPQHPPLYFLLTRFWAECFGSSKISIRSLPVVFSLLTFPVIFLLCQELFESPTVGWLAMALYAVSPICVRYAQEVRQYSFWLTITLVSCVALLRAMRQPTKLNWGIYILVITTGFYCHLLTGLVAIAHGIYILITEKFRPTQKLAAYLLSLVISLTVFSPWILILWRNIEVVKQTTSFMSLPLPLQTLIQFWSLSVCRAFVAWHFQYNQLLIYLTIPILLLVLYAFYFLCRYGTTSTWLFILILIITMILPFLILDLVGGGRRSTSERFFLPCYLGIYLAVSYLLVSKISTYSTNMIRASFWQKFWRLVTVVIISSSIFSCVLSLKANTWWGWSEFDVKISALVQQKADSLIISDTPIFSILPFSQQLNPNTMMLLLDRPESFLIPDGFSHVFLYNPSENLLSVAKQRNFKTELAYQFKDPMTSLMVSLYQIDLGKS